MCFLLLAVIFLPAGAGAQAKDGSYKDMCAEVLKYVNKHRAEKGLKPLVMIDAISKIAEEHSRNMAGGRVPFGHEGMDERVARANKMLKQGASAWAENIASGQRSGKGAVEKWLTSQGHTENIEGSYSQTGIGIAKSPQGTFYFTQIFIRKK